MAAIRPSLQTRKVEMWLELSATDLYANGQRQASQVC